MTPIATIYVSRLYADIRGTFETIWECDICAALSSETATLADLTRLNGEVQDLINYRLIWNSEEMIGPDFAERRNAVPFVFPVTDERELIELLKKGDQKGAVAKYGEITALLTGSRYENIMLGFSRLAASFFDYFNTLEQCSGNSGPIRYTRFMARFNRCRRESRGCGESS